MSTSIPPAVGGRDHRLDVFRGLALLTIFVNHVPGNIYEALTSRNFGFSDAAEAFVLMSGIAVGLAYARGFRSGDLGKALLRVWRRAGTIYVTHIVTTVFAIAIVAGGILFLDTAELVEKFNFTRLLDRPLSAMVGVPTLGHQLGYFNILPLYFMLLVVSPLYIMIGLRDRWAMIGLAALIWLAAGTFRLNLPNYPNPGGWFFNPLSWQLIYAIGIAAGLSASEGRKLVPFNRRLFYAAAIFLAFALMWIKLRMGALPGRQHLPFFIAGFDKTFLSLPRLLHTLALAYVLTNLAAVSRLLAEPAFRPVALMGQNGLAVFATGSVLSIALQVLRARFETTVLEDTALILGGILLQYAVARFLSETSEKKRRTAALPDLPLAAAVQSQSGIESKPMSAS
ncbi:OpgC family protein [Chelativorans alearense]|uniref:OpgC family protein n=1 Tax=Chelativorans alearense TaxID=2681495 RepID=UPI0013D218E5|nr:OpgC domain-containing protein [Chelativorans alearense]